MIFERKNTSRAAINALKGLTFPFVLMLCLVACTDYEAGVEEKYEDWLALNDVDSDSDPESSSGIADLDPESSADEESSSSSFDEELSSSGKGGIPYTMVCPTGKTCTYAPTEQLNSEITYGEFLDTRDYQMYKTVTIGKQTWMAQNLNYDYNEGSAKSYCYDNDEGYCSKYGRLYTWAAAMDSAAVFSKAGEGCGYGNECSSSGPIRGVCPDGWHLPITGEWNALFTSVGGVDVAGGELKSFSGWNSDGNGDDSFGFAVLPAGYRTNYGGFNNAGSLAYFWSSTESSRYTAYDWYFHYGRTGVYSYGGNEYYGRSVRCLRYSNDVGSEASSSSSQAKLSSSSSVIPDSDSESQCDEMADQARHDECESIKSSSSEASGIPYTTECPAGKTCTYAPTEQLNPEITYGEFLDTRDYQVYKTVTIDTQTWMAQNLNYAYTGVPYSYTFGSTTYESDSISWCYGNVADSCAKYGRLYTWAAAIDSVALAKDGNTCGYGETCDRLTDENLAANPIRGVCPSGWHLPSDAERDALLTAVGGSSTAGKALKSTSGWYSDGNGTDAYGFSALPAGYRDIDGVFYYVGIYATFWSSTEYNSHYAYHMYLHYSYENAYLHNDYKYNGYSVRCIKNSN